MQEASAQGRARINSSRAEPSRILRRYSSPPAPPSRGCRPARLQSPREPMAREACNQEEPHAAAPPPRLRLRRRRAFDLVRSQPRLRPGDALVRHRPDQALRAAAAPLPGPSAGAAHRRQDHGDPPRQAPRSLREQPQRRPQGPRAAREDAPARAPGQVSEAPEVGPHGAPQQRRRPRQPLDVLADHGPRTAAAPRATSRPPSTARSAASTSCRSSSTRPAARCSARAGCS